MSDGSKIEWTDATVNAINGCSLASPGCTNCYAMRLAGTRMKNHPSRKGLTIDTRAGPVWNGQVRLVESALSQPLRWQRSRIIFWNAHGDLFHPAVPDAWIDRQFAVMIMTHQHKHLVLTKRSARMREYLSRHRWHIWSAIGREMNPRRWEALPPIMGGDCTPVPNVWLGVSVEDQARADERIPDLLATPAAGRFLSCEPLLGPVDLRWIAEPDEEKDGVIDALLGCNWVDGMGQGTEFRPARPGHQDRVMTRRVCSSQADILAARKIDGVIVGGESGTGARPMHPAWARSIRDQCASAGTAFHFKQWGNFSPLRAAPPVEGEGVGAVAWPDGTVGGGHADKKGGAGQQMYCATKAIAGRELDGRTHDALPWRPAP